MKTNKELIDKLKQGHIAIDNTGNPNVELLRAVLKEAFPKAFNDFTFQASVYYKSRDREDDWANLHNNLPTIPLNDFLEKEQFPKNDFGVIVENNNGKEIIDYLVSKGFINKSSGVYSYGNYVVSKNTKEFCHLLNVTQNKFTLQQLKNLENNMENKEIIGYRCPTDLFKGTVKKGTIYTNKLSKLGQLYYPEYEKDYTAIGNQKGVATEIVETWEPVYKSKEVVIKMGNSFDLTIKDGKVWHKSDNITQFVQNLVNCFDYVNKDQSYGQYKAQFKDVIFSSTGCERTETKLSEWILVYNELQKQK